jgi:signal transduction histidine kinase
VRAETTPDGGARIVVADEGPGIAPGERARVFLPYERGSAAAATAAPGTGLGLALVRDLVAGMGGSVALDETPPTASSDASRGATFVITIPGATDG